MSFFRNNIILRKSKFSPNKIPGLGLWLESDYGITKDGSNAVSEWVDRSPNGYTLTQSTGANQPIFTVNEFGSQAGLIFDGSNDSLERSVSNPFSTTQNFTCFMVCKTTTGTGDENWFSMGDLGTSDSFLIFKGNGTNWNNSLTIITNIGGGGDVVVGNQTINNNIGKLLVSESNGVSWFERINRVNQILSNPTGSNTGEAPGDFTTLDNITLGMFRRSTTVYNIGNFAAVLFYERQLSVAERTKVEDYLINKYGIII